MMRSAGAMKGRKDGCSVQWNASKKRRVGGLLAGSLLVVALSSSACASASSSSSSTSVSTSSSSSSSPATASSKRSSSKGPIIIGGLAGTTGAYAAAGLATINAAKLAVQQINKSGGILGRRVKFVWYNDAFSSTLDAQQFKHLVSQGAVAISGSPSEGPTAASLASRYKVPVIGDVGAGGTTIYPNGPGTAPLPWAFSNSPSTFAMAQVEAKFALASCKKLAVFFGNDTYSPSENTIFKQTFAAAGRSNDIVVDQEVTENLTTGATVPLTSEVSALGSSKADCVYIGLDPQDDGSFVVTMHQQGVSVKHVIGGDTMLATNTYPSLAGDLADGTYSVAERAVANPGRAAKAFVAAYTKEFHIAPVIYGYAAYDGVKLLAKAIALAGSTKNTAILDKLNHMTRFPGIMGVLSLSKSQHCTDSVSTEIMMRYSAATKTWSPAGA
jgi:branched-chain amino acid transport system substrate-binding protein